MRNGILAGGNWILDRVKIIDAYPEEETLANILSETECNGGSPFNILLDLSKFGAKFPLSAVGLIGEDRAGNQILEICKEAGIDTDQLRQTSKASTSYTDVMTVQGTGRRTFFHQRGANALLDDSDFDFSHAEAKLFHLGYLLLLDQMDSPHEDGTVAAHTLRRAQEAGMKTSIDVVSEWGKRYREIVYPALQHCDFCFMNDFEAMMCTNHQLRGQTRVITENFVHSAKALRNQGVREWVVIHFAEGAYALGPDGQQLWQDALTVPQDKIASTVGAGDAFAAGVLYGVHEGAKFQEALRYGVSAAAACIKHSTTSGGILELSECVE